LDIFSSLQKILYILRYFVPILFHHLFFCTKIFASNIAVFLETKQNNTGRISQTVLCSKTFGAEQRTKRVSDGVRSLPRQNDSRKKCLI